MTAMGKIAETALATALAALVATWLAYHGIVARHLSAAGWIVSLALLAMASALAIGNWRELIRSIRDDEP